MRNITENFAATSGNVVKIPRSSATHIHTASALSVRNLGKTGHGAPSRKTHPGSSGGLSARRSSVRSAPAAFRLCRSRWISASSSASW